MKSIHLVIFLILITLVAVASSSFLSCGGGGGGDGEAPPPPPPSGGGTGADGVVIFWYPFDTNEAVGAGNAVQETSDHGFVVAGTEANNFSSSSDVFLMKTDSNGAAQWKKRFAWTGGALANAVRQTSDGGSIVVGETGAQTGNRRVYALKADASGNAEPGWPKTYGTADSRGFAVLEVSNPQGYMIVGYQYKEQENENMYVIRTDTAGTVVWENYGHWTPCFGAGEFGRSLAATADGNFVIAGTAGCYGWKGFLTKIDGQGNTLSGWPKMYGGTSSAVNEGLYSVAVAPDGFVLSGFRSPVSSGQPPVVGPSDALVIKTDLNGNELWRRTYGGADQDEAHGVVLTKDNNYIVMGYTQSYGGTVNPDAQWQYQDVHMIKLDAGGNTIWQKVKGNKPMASDYGGAGAAVSDGGFVVTGSSGGNVLLAKFDKNGDTINLGATDLTITVTGTQGIINAGNAVNLAAAGVAALREPGEAGSYALGFLLARYRQESVTNFCSSGGYSVDYDPLNLTLRTYTITLIDCVKKDSDPPQTLNGTVVVTLDSVTGDPKTADYSVQVTINQFNITAVETSEGLTNTLSGGMKFTENSTGGNLARVSQSIDSPATKLTFTETENGLTYSWSSATFVIHDNVGTSGAYSYGTAGDHASVLTSFPGAGAGLQVNIVAVSPIQGTGQGTIPNSGSFTVTATDNSRETATISNGIVNLAVDTNGDGTIDGNVSAAWIDYFD